MANFIIDFNSVKDSLYYQNGNCKDSQLLSWFDSHNWEYRFCSDVILPKGSYIHFVFFVGEMEFDLRIDDVVISLCPPDLNVCYKVTIPILSSGHYSIRFLPH